MQAAFSPLWADELYYTAWAARPALYYFDHPPLVAWSIWLGQLLAHNALGIRLMALIYHAVTLFFVGKILGTAQALVRFLVLGTATLLFHVSGFLSVPDSPYLMGCAAYLFFLQKFLSRPTLLHGFALLLSAAWTVNSKYHGWLFLILSLLPHIMFLLSQGRRLILPIIAFTALIMPVYYNAALHGFETLWLHLGGRHTTHRFPQFTWDYLTGWLGSTGLWLYPYGLWRAWPKGSDDPFSSSLISVALGFPLTMVAISFFSSVETNWAAPALLTLLILLSHTDISLKKPALLAALIPLWLIVFSLRVLTLTHPEILARWRPLDFTEPEKWVQPIQKKAEGLPVVFLNSYQLAAAYSWHTGQPAYSLNNFNYRRNQYDVWQWDTAYWGKPVYFFSNWPFPGLEKITDRPFVLYGNKINRWYSFPQVRIVWKNFKTTWKKGQTITITLELINNYDKALPEFFRESGAHILVTFWKDGHRLDNEESYLPLANDFFPLEPGERHSLTQTLKLPDQAGRYRVNFCLRLSWLESGYNSPFYTLRLQQ